MQLNATHATCRSVPTSIDVLVTLMLSFPKLSQISRCFRAFRIMAGWMSEKVDLVDQKKEGFQSHDQEHHSEVTLIDIKL